MNISKMAKSDKSIHYQKIRPVMLVDIIQNEFLIKIGMI